MSTDDSCWGPPAKNKTDDSKLNKRNAEGEWYVRGGGGGV